MIGNLACVPCPLPMVAFALRCAPRVVVDRGCSTPLFCLYPLPPVRPHRYIKKKGDYSSPLIKLSMYRDLFVYCFSRSTAASLNRIVTTLLRVPEGRPAPFRFPPRLLFICSLSISLMFCTVEVLCKHIRCAFALCIFQVGNTLLPYFRIFLYSIRSLGGRTTLRISLMINLMFSSYSFSFL